MPTTVSFTVFCFQLMITSRDQNKVNHSSSVVQYKIHEKTVTCFAPGLSKAVL